MVGFPDRIAMTPHLCLDLFRNTRPPHGTVSTFTALCYIRWWPVWMRYSISSLVSAGITMRSSYVNKPLHIDKCPGESKNSRIWGTSSTCVGHPSYVNSITFRSWTSFALASLILFGWSPVAVFVDYPNSANAWTSSAVSGSCSNLQWLLDRVSAITICLQGTCSAWGLNRIRCIRSLWHLNGVLLRSLWLISGTRGLWSVKIWKLRSPIR